MTCKVRSGSGQFHMKHEFLVTIFDDDDDGRRHKLVIQLPINFYHFLKCSLGYILAQSINIVYIYYICVCVCIT